MNKDRNTIKFLAAMAVFAMIFAGITTSVHYSEEIEAEEYTDISTWEELTDAFDKGGNYRITGAISTDYAQSKPRTISEACNFIGVSGAKITVSDIDAGATSSLGAFFRFTADSTWSGVEFDFDFNGYQWKNAILGCSNADLTVTGCTFSGDNCQVFIGHNYSGDLKVQNCEFNGGYQALFPRGEGGDVTVSGNTFNGSLSAITLEPGDNKTYRSVKIENNTFNMNRSGNTTDSRYPADHCGATTAIALYAFENEWPTNLNISGNEFNATNGVKNAAFVLSCCSPYLGNYDAKDLIIGTYDHITAKEQGNTFNGSEQVIEYAYHSKGETSWTFSNITDSPAVCSVTDGSGKVTYYTSLGAAIDAAGSGNTIKMLKDVDLGDTLNVSKNLTIDLNGHTITGSGKRAIHVTENTLILTGSGTVTCSGSMSDSSSVIRVGDGSGTSAGLEIGKNVTVTTALSYTVTIFGGETNGQTLTVKGTVSLTGTTAAAISGNGSSNWKETTITIEDGAKVTATSGSAIYHPQAGTLNIAGTVSGPSGLEIKAGGCNVNLLDTAIITATSSTTTHVKNGNGNSTTGYSIAVVENSGYKGNPTLNLSKGTLVGPVALVADDVVTDKKGSITISGGTVKGTISLVNTSETEGDPPAGSIVITGGTFSEDPTQFVPEGYIVVQDGEGNYIVGKPVTATFDSKGGSAVKSQTVISGQKIMKPSDPTKEGNIFDGWYTDSALTTEYDFATKVTSSFTLYAKWEETPATLYTVTFMDDATVLYSTQVEESTMVSKPDEPTKTGYRFSGWYTENGGTTKFDFTTKIVENTTLYAGWVQLCYVSVPAGVDGIFTTTNSGVNQIDLSITTQFTFTVTAADGYELEVYANDEQLTPSDNEYTVTDLSKNVDIYISATKDTEEVEAVETVVENDDGTTTESSAVATKDTATDRIDVKETSVVKDGETTKSSSITTATIAGGSATISIETTDTETATISSIIADAVTISGSPVSVNVVVETPKVTVPKELLTSEMVTDLIVNLNTGSSNQATITVPVGAIAAEDIADNFALSVTPSTATPSQSALDGSSAVDAFDLGLTGTNTTVFDKPVTVSYDVTLPEGAENVRVYCIDEGRFYDATYSNGTVVFTIPHFSTWTIVYDEPEDEKTIIEDDDDILFILEQQRKAREAAEAASQTTTGDDSGEEAAIIIAAAAVAGAMLACAFFAFRRN